MYLVKIINGDQTTVIHQSGAGDVKVMSGQIKRATNSIASFEFSVNPANPGYGAIQPLITQIQVVNMKEDVEEFAGRVLSPKDSMDTNGSFAETYTCEDCLGYLHDTAPGYETLTGTISTILGHLLSEHNAQVEDYKKIQPGNVTGNAQYTLYTTPETDTYDTIHTFVVDTVGYEHQLRRSDGVNYLDVSPEFGVLSDQKIQLSQNLQSITVEADPTSIISRLIPLGATKQDSGSTATTDTPQKPQERVNLGDIGKPLYLDSPDLITKYGIQTGVQIFDEITDANQLTAWAQAWFNAQREVHVKYTVTALNLALIGLGVDDFQLSNRYQTINPVMHLDEPLRVIGQTVDIIKPETASLTIGDKFKTGNDYAAANNDLSVQISKVRVTAVAADTKATKAIADVTQLKTDVGSLPNTVEALKTTLQSALNNVAALKQMTVTKQLTATITSPNDPVTYTFTWPDGFYNTNAYVAALVGTVDGDQQQLALPISYTSSAVTVIAPVKTTTLKAIFQKIGG
jgi:hypothetical protein